MVTAVIALLLLSSAAAMLGAPAGAQIPPQLTFNSVRDYPLDTNTNGLYDELFIELGMEVTRTGGYTVKIRLYVDVSGNEVDIITKSNNTYLTEGDNTYSMSFPSETIFNKGLSGTYRADVEVQYFNGTTRWTITHPTRFYDHESFEAKDNPPPVPPDAPKVELDLNYVNVSTEVFRVFVNRTSPEIVFRYRDTGASLPDFLLTYQRLILFRDDGDHVYDGESPTASVMLTNYPWTLGTIEVSGPRVSFDLRSRVPIPVGTDFVTTDVVLTFTVTNGSLLTTSDSDFVRGDASELKVDILFMPEEGIPGADHVCFQALVGDSLASHDFLVEEPVGFRLYPRAEETPFLPVPRLRDRSHTVVGLVDANGVWHAYVGWLDVAEETWSSREDTLLVDVGGSFRVLAGSMEVYTAYPYSESLVSLDHDPSVGTVRENTPPDSPGPLPPAEPEANIYVFWFALVAGAVIILLTLYARAQGY